eukprot:CAMPEP_0185593102 /NCGR_PEP_ID=MMETSP0434-20130131/70378_1 /TAXON_ID=626734 ORGANISM="Favella taraikaensis, Strain Fe Narragansett Bay" /NCGR_SAMPLE_ID=MMETSP0434 /ASSEMBLY_ACC=CAM_ASM_000379 /LENGTH=85 /DNA_ID=CAMNT_0028219437 /DNA_START=610 /DNA_END=866 /DNA_ORIENTATION=-
MTADSSPHAPRKEPGSKSSTRTQHKSSECTAMVCGRRSICHLAFSGKMNYLAAAGLSNTVHCWKLGLSPSESVQADSPEEANQED